MRGFFGLLIGTALLTSIGCVPLEEPGGVLQAHETGVKSQSTLDSGPVQVSPTRRAELVGDVAAAVVEPKSSSDVTPDAPAEVDVPAEVDGPAEVDVPAEIEPADDVVAEVEPEPPPVSDPAPGTVPEVVEAEEPAEMPVKLTADAAAAAPAPDSSAPEGDTGAPPILAAPASDVEAVAALDALPRRPARPAPTPSFGDGPSASSERCVSQDSLSSTPLTQLNMVRWDSVHGRPVATLATPSGQEFRVEVGDRVGPRGGLVVAIDSGKVTVYELRLDDRETATKVREVIKLRP